MIQLEQEQSQVTDQAVVLAVQDTTSFNFSGRQIEGLGVLDDNCAAGFFAHTTLQVSVEGVPLGLADQQVWRRAPHTPEQKDDHKQRPIEQKESYKWLVGLTQSLAATPTQQIITICDREADIYELLALAAVTDTSFIVRSTHNRRTQSGDLLAQAVAQQPTIGTFTVEALRRPPGEAQKVTMNLRYTTLTLLAPQRKTAAACMPLEPLTVQVVDAVESDPPPGEKPLHWRLVTNLPVADLAAAQRVLRYYSYRWLVERFHYVLKSGCQFEASQLATYAALTNHLALCSSVAWRLLHLTYQARRTPDTSCEPLLPAVAWQALTAFLQQSPTPSTRPPTLREAVRAIARLGGFLARKGDGEPGVKVLWRGLARLDDLVSFWLILHPQLVGND